jgi:hypothetical protein
MTAFGVGGNRLLGSAVREKDGWLVNRFFCVLNFFIIYCRNLVLFLTAGELWMLAVFTRDSRLDEKTGNGTDRC